MSMMKTPGTRKAITTSASILVKTEQNINNSTEEKSLELSTGSTESESSSESESSTLETSLPPRTVFTSSTSVSVSTSSSDSPTTIIIPPSPLSQREIYIIIGFTNALLVLLLIVITLCVFRRKIAMKNTPVQLFINNAYVHDRDGEIVIIKSLGKTLTTVKDDLSSQKHKSDRVCKNPQRMVLTNGSLFNDQKRVKSMDSIKMDCVESSELNFYETGFIQEPPSGQYSSIYKVASCPGNINSSEDPCCADADFKQCGPRYYHQEKPVQTLNQGQTKKMNVSYV